MIRMILGAVTAVCLALSSPMVAKAAVDETATPLSPICDIGAEGLCLYQGTNYSGAGEYWGWAMDVLPSGWNDTASSLKNTFPFEMTIYTQINYMGSSRDIPGKTNIPNLGAIYTPGGVVSWENQISSFKHNP